MYLYFFCLMAHNNVLEVFLDLFTLFSFPFLSRTDQNIDLPEEGKYATGLIFIDKDKGPDIKAIFESFAKKFGMQV